MVPHIILNTGIYSHTGIFGSRAGIHVNFYLISFGTYFQIIIGCITGLGKQNIIYLVIGINRSA